MEGTTEGSESRERRCGRPDRGKTEPYIGASGSTTRSGFGATTGESVDEGADKSEEDAVGAAAEAGAACVAAWRRARRRLRRPIVREGVDGPEMRQRVETQRRNSVVWDEARIDKSGRSPVQRRRLAGARDLERNDARVLGCPRQRRVHQSRWRHRCSSRTTARLVRQLASVGAILCSQISNSRAARTRLPPRWNFHHCQHNWHPLIGCMP